MAGLGDLIVVVEDRATYQAALDQGKTAPSVMYLILKERQIIFNSELWSKAPEEGGGGGDTEELEEVAAAGLVDLNERLLHLQDELFLYAGKKDLAEVQQELTDALLENEEILAGALTDHETRIKESEKRISDCITRYENNLQAVKTTEEIESNEKVVAYAMVEVKTIVEDLQKRIYQLENRL